MAFCHTGNCEIVILFFTKDNSKPMSSVAVPAVRIGNVDEYECNPSDLYTDSGNIVEKLFSLLK